MLGTLGSPRSFPSRFFYEGQLRDGVSDSQRAGHWHRCSTALGPLVVWDVAEGRAGRARDTGASARGVRGGSLQNPLEAACAAALFRGEPRKGR